MRMGLRSFLIVLLLTVPAVAQATPLWSMRPGQSEIVFIAMQGGAPVKGLFTRFQAELKFDPAALEESRFRVEIDVASLDSGNTDRDSTLRSNAFFDVATWPQAVFEADDVRALGEGRYQAHGTLTLRDRSLPVVLPFHLELAGTPGQRRATAEGELTINRIDYGVGQGQWADTSVIADGVRIAVKILAEEQAD